jgi:hypothetical protein
MRNIVLNFCTGLIFLSFILFIGGITVKIFTLYGLNPMSVIFIGLGVIFIYSIGAAVNR